MKEKGEICRPASGRECFSGRCKWCRWPVSPAVGGWQRGCVDWAAEELLGPHVYQSRVTTYGLLRPPFTPALSFRIGLRVYDNVPCSGPTDALHTRRGHMPADPQLGTYPLPVGMDDLYGLRTT